MNRLLVLLAVLLAACGGGSGGAPPAAVAVTLDLLATTSAALEGNADGGGTQAVVSLSLSQPAAEAVTVDYITASGTATEEQDYARTLGTATIPAGHSVTNIFIPLRGDTEIEGEENFSLRFSNVRNAKLAQEAVLISIRDDDTVPAGGGGGGGGTPPVDPPDPPVPTGKRAPQVTLGADRSERESTALTLKSFAQDADGSVVSYEWRQLSGPPALTGPVSASALNVSLPPVSAAGQALVFRLTVTDNEGLKGRDEITLQLLDTTASASRVRAGVAVEDASGRLGASSGQYADTSSGPGQVPSGYDPNNFSTAKLGSYGVQSRTSVRALVIEGNNGQRVALLKSDNYLAQDLLARRVAQLLASGTSGIGYDQIVHSATHNHSSPYQFTQSAGVWVFQDAYNQYAFEEIARAMARAIERAAAGLRPVRMSATKIAHKIVKGNVVGRSTAVDGTPAGYPINFGDYDFIVMRLDDVSVSPPKPLAFWLNHGEHPESLDGQHLTTADFLGPLQRFVERELGAPLIFSQGDVGSSEGPYAGRENSYPLALLDARYTGLSRSWAHSGYAQIERQGRILADAVADANTLIEVQADSVQLKWSEDFPVQAFSRFIPGPVSHPYPTVGNCIADNTYNGDPGAPAAPDCERQSGYTGETAPGLTELNAFISSTPAGMAFPQEYGNAGHPAVEENQRIRLQAVRLGEMLMGSCACEAQVDMFLNLKSRADKIQGNIFDGFDWACLAAPYSSEAVCQNQLQYYNPAQWDFPDLVPPSFGTTMNGSLSDPAKVAHFRAQVHNDARGWDDPAYAPTAQGREPTDPAQIKGNFTKEELPENLGYALIAGLGHTGDYNGYTVSYREYQSRDSYRKALTAYGPHTADYMITRLVRMAGQLKGGPAIANDPNSATVAEDEQRMDAQARGVGQESGPYYDQFPDTLPDEPAAPSLLTEPLSITHFQAAKLVWRGGSSGIDNPLVRVERRVGMDWVSFADQSGEVATRTMFPADEQALGEAKAGQFEWQWQALFEAFASLPANTGTVPFGEYRFVVEGQSRQGGATLPYAFISVPFTVAPWGGLSAGDIQRDAGSVSFTFAAPAYPRTYTDSGFFFTGDDGGAIICKTCTFRAWAAGGEGASAEVTVTRSGGAVETVPAIFMSPSGRWVADTRLADGETARIAAGGLRDTQGEINGVEFVVP